MTMTDGWTAKFYASAHSTTLVRVQRFVLLHGVVIIKNIWFLCPIYHYYIATLPTFFFFFTLLVALGRYDSTTHII
ncbi:hypothetical protein QBC46DRAFT_376719 [Diplogelasinospora grovesii]|uniref:Uncharacterized protein n=1 Tax=Diplogelasinospora grovesii TaxID=303347 RepID=A0AAN6NGD3_9PEZI|nr:hypothetical protein QBC46DRAFT_376719 [Diplogelasinospora grovesii]